MKKREKTNNHMRIPKCLLSAEMSKGYGREIYLKAMLSEALFYVVFVTILSILVYDYSSSDIDLFTTSLVNKFIRSEIDRDMGIGGYTFQDVNTIDQVWIYLNYLVKVFDKSNLFPSKTNLLKIERRNHKSMTRDSDLIGLPRIRTFRVSKVTCQFLGQFNHDIPCYPYYSSECENREPFGLKNGSAWFFKSTIKTGLDLVHGKVSCYSGAGFYQDCPKSKSKFERVLESLKAGKWIDRATRAVVVDFSIYNVNLDVFAIVKLLFEMPPTGGVVTSYTIDSLKITDVKNKTTLYIVCVVVFIIFTLFFTFQHTCELIYLRWNFFNSFCNCLNLIITLMCYFVIMANIHKILLLKTSLKEIVSNDFKYANFSHVRYTQNACAVTESILILLSWVKFLKYISINHSIYQLQITLQMSQRDIFWCSVILLYVMFIFAFTGCLLFGNVVESYDTLSSTVWTVLQVGRGEFDYNHLQTSRPNLGPIYYLIVLFYVRLLFVAVYVAILLNAYSDMSRESKYYSANVKAGDILKKCLVDFIEQFSRKQARRLRSYFNRKKIRKEFQGAHHLLKRYGFTQIEIDALLAKYNISNDKVLTNEDMREIRKRSVEDRSDIKLVRRLVRSNVEEKLSALEEAVGNASKKITLILQVFNVIEKKMSSRQ